jgi:hypothetical protein
MHKEKVTEGRQPNGYRHVTNRMAINVHFISKEPVLYIKTLLVVSLLVISPLASACGFISGLFTSEKVPLSYVGTISFQKPITEGNETRITLTFSGGKWGENSGIVLKNVRSRLDGHEIHLTVVTCVAGGDARNAELSLQGLSSGKYKLIYENPDNTEVPLGDIDI